MYLYVVCVCGCDAKRFVQQVNCDSYKSPHFMSHTHTHT